MNLGPLTREASALPLSYIIPCDRLYTVICGHNLPTLLFFQLAGPPGCGKTQLCVTLSVMTALPAAQGGCGLGVVYIDTEATFSAERCSSMNNHCRIVCRSTTCICVRGEPEDDTIKFGGLPISRSARFIVYKVVHAIVCKGRAPGTRNYTPKFTKLHSNLSVVMANYTVMCTLLQISP